MVKDETGETCVPMNPQRLITLHTATLSNALILGVKPIGSVGEYQERMLPKYTYLKDRVEGINFLGGVTQPSLEKILLLKPDLIISMNFEQRIYPLLSKIASTVQYNWESTKNWREHFNFVATVLGKQKVAQEIWSNYYKRIEELQTALGEPYRHKKISLLYFCCNSIFSEVKNSFAGSILNDLELQRPEAQDIVEPSGLIYISEEELQKVDADVLFVVTYDSKDNNVVKKLQKRPLWNQLQAVKKNQVYFVDYSIWRGGNLLAANAVIDDLFKHLVTTP
jgi:iron complex transport system substrate-binding protein